MILKVLANYHISSVRSNSNCISGQFRVRSLSHPVFTSYLLVLTEIRRMSFICSIVQEYSLLLSDFVFLRFRDKLVIRQPLQCTRLLVAEFLHTLSSAKFSQQPTIPNRMRELSKQDDARRRVPWVLVLL